MAHNDKSPREAVILSGARLAQGKLLGALTPFNAAQLGQMVVRAAVERSGIDPADLNEVIVGQVLAAGAGQALPRQIALGAGIPPHVGGMVVNKVCGSSLKATMLAAGQIRAGDGDLYVAAGVESMTNAPFMDLKGRQGHKYGHFEMMDAILWDGLWDHVENWVMGEAAELIAREYGITRAEMDAFSTRSHQLAHQATEDGCFKEEIVPVELRDRKGNVTLFDRDESIRPDTTVETLARLKPAFIEDGLVTAGNSPGLNDGAAALVVASRAYAEQKGHAPLARIAGYGQAAVEPKWLFAAPIHAIPVALERAGWTVDDLDLVEINEAFAAQVLADLKGLKQNGVEIPLEKLNVHGGGIAIGHPIGASGARVLVTLIHALKQRGLKRGLAALCLGGGEAVALAVEME
ncbi:MAG TPA: acetyl-CoA C-acetyltransferase [Aggregatilineaceae bacterium]|jgi:acetyl-CoA C-acetyltransferase|nr:acetyl-CoA C-acetyltransferase [Anaerolineae bacterium]HMM28724.1 acetyl-CoA C-acetyltransferase [Aggregatilineaceae bacterium]